METSERKFGIVVRWLNGKGFGFARIEGSQPGDKDVFVPGRCVRRDTGAEVELAAGTRVSFLRRTDSLGRAFAADVAVERPR